MSLVIKKVPLQRTIINLGNIPNIIDTIQWYIRIKIFDQGILSKIRNNKPIKYCDEISKFFVEDVKNVIKSIGAINSNSAIIQINVDKENSDKCKKLEYSIKVFFNDLFNAKSFDNICTNFSY